MFSKYDYIMISVFMIKRCVHDLNLVLDIFQKKKKELAPPDLFITSSNQKYLFSFLSKKKYNRIILLNLY